MSAASGGEGALFAAPGSRVATFTEAASWLWRLGKPLSEPASHAIGFGWLDEAADLASAVRGGGLAGAVVFAPRPGPDVDFLPPRRRVRGIAEFAPGESVRGEFPLFSGGNAFASSSLGNHAVRDGPLLGMAVDPEATWGSLDSYWLYPTLVRFLSDVLDRPLTLLPAVGWIRHDDLPGDAHLQAVGTAKPDARVRRRVVAIRKSFHQRGQRINMAISACGRVDGRDTPVDEIWPEATEAIRQGVREGTIEPVSHGYSHLDPVALERGEVDAREYRMVDASEAGRRVDSALAWHREALGAEPSTFVAPNWAYGPGLREALAERRIRCWLPPTPGPLLNGSFARETLVSNLEGLDGLSYAPLARLASAGVPPMIVLHGGLFDARLNGLGLPRDARALARLYFRRDLFRIAGLEGVDWVGAGEMFALLEAHANS